jgi:hypothetical protein
LAEKYRLRMITNTLFKTKLGPNREEVNGRLEHYILRSTTICIRDEIKEDEMDRA